MKSFRALQHADQAIDQRRPGRLSNDHAERAASRLSSQIWAILYGPFVHKSFMQERAWETFLRRINKSSMAVLAVPAKEAKIYQFIQTKAA